MNLDGIDWHVNVKPISAGRIDGTVNALEAKFMVLIHDLPDKPYVSVSTDGGKTYAAIPNSQVHSVKSRGMARWRLDAPAEPTPGEGVWLLVEAIRQPG